MDNLSETKKFSKLTTFICGLVYIILIFSIEAIIVYYLSIKTLQAIELILLILFIAIPIIFYIVLRKTIVKNATAFVFLFSVVLFYVIGLAIIIPFVLPLIPSGTLNLFSDEPSTPNHRLSAVLGIIGLSIILLFLIVIDFFKSSFYAIKNAKQGNEEQ